MDSYFALDAPALIKVCGVELDRRSENTVLVTAMCFSDGSTKCRVLDVKPSTQSGLEKAGKQAGRIGFRVRSKSLLSLSLGMAGNCEQCPSNCARWLISCQVVQAEYIVPRYVVQS